MAAKKEEGDQHVAHVAFKIPNFWPHDPTTWLRKMESKFRICNITESSTKYDHLLSALPTEVCSNINDSLVEIDENAADTYEQLKGLLMSRYTKDRWARAFELHKFPEIGDMKPSEMMRQMKALLPTDTSPGTYFMAAFLLRLPADMIDHIISKDFKDVKQLQQFLGKVNFLQMFPSRYRPHTTAGHRCTPRGPHDTRVAARRRLWSGQIRPGGCGTTGAPRPERCALPSNRRLPTHM
jgi:hypothetical protein